MITDPIMLGIALKERKAVMAIASG